MHALFRRGLRLRSDPNSVLGSGPNGVNQNGRKKISARTNHHQTAGSRRTAKPGEDGVRAVVPVAVEKYCRVIGQPRSTQRYDKRLVADEEPLQEGL